MSSKLAPAPAIARDTARALVAAATEFAAGRSWEYMCDSDVVGLTDAKTGETRLVTVLGNANEVYGAVFYRRASGLRWLLNALEDSDAGPNLESFAEIDALKFELVRKNELGKENLALLKAADFKPPERGTVWPLFQSIEPGWRPWFVDQTEAEQLSAYLPCLTAFTILYRDNRSIFQDRQVNEIPFLPHPMASRLEAKDLEWRTMIVSPENFEPFKPAEDQLAQLSRLKRETRVSVEYGSKLLMGGVLEKGRPCYTRANLLVQHGNGIVLGVELSLAITPFAESAGAGLVKTLRQRGFLPGKLMIDDTRLAPILGSLCDVLKIELVLSDELKCLGEAKASLDNYMRL